MYRGRNGQPVLLVVLTLIGLAAGNLIARSLAGYIPLLSQKTAVGIDFGSIEITSICNFHFGLTFIFTPLGVLGAVVGVVLYTRLARS